MHRFLTGNQEMKKPIQEMKPVPIARWPTGWKC